MKKLFLTVCLIILSAQVAMAAQCGPGATPEKSVCDPGDTIMGNYTFPTATYTFGVSGTATAFIIGTAGITIDASAATFQMSSETEGRIRSLVASVMGDPNTVTAFYANDKDGLTINGGKYIGLASILNSVDTTAVIDGAYGEKLGRPIYVYNGTGDMAYITNSTLVLCKSVQMMIGSAGNTCTYSANEYDTSVTGATGAMSTGIRATSIPTGSVVGAQVSLGIVFTLVADTTVSTITATSSGGETVGISGSGTTRTLTFTPTKEGLYAIHCVLTDSSNNVFNQKFQVLVGTLAEKTTPTFYLRGSIVPDGTADTEATAERPYTIANPYSMYTNARDDYTVASNTAPSESEHADCSSWVQAPFNPTELFIGRIKSMAYSVMASTTSASPPVSGTFSLIKMSGYNNCSTTTINRIAFTNIGNTSTEYSGTMDISADPIAIENFADINGLHLYFTWSYVMLRSPSTFTFTYDIPNYPRLITVSDRGLIVLSADHAVGSQNYSARIHNPTDSSITANIIFEHTTGDSFNATIDSGTPTILTAADNRITVPITVAAGAYADLTMDIRLPVGTWYLSTSGTGGGTTVNDPATLAYLPDLSPGSIVFITQPGYSGSTRTLTPISGALYFSQLGLTQPFDLSIYGSAQIPIWLDDSWKNILPVLGSNFHTRWFDGIEN